MGDGDLGCSQKGKDRVFQIIVQRVTIVYFSLGFSPNRPYNWAAKSLGLGPGWPGLNSCSVKKESHLGSSLAL